MSHLTHLTSFAEDKSIGLDLNSLVSTTGTIEMGSSLYASLCVANKAGVATAWVMTLQCSPNGIDWIDMSGTLTGIGPNIITAGPFVSRLVRAKVTTVAGGGASADVYLQVK